MKYFSEHLIEFICGIVLILTLILVGIPQTDIDKNIAYPVITGIFGIFGGTSYGKLKSVQTPA